MKDVKFPLMLDVYELCTTELQEKMLPIRSKFKEIEDKKLEKQQQKVRPPCWLCHLSFSAVSAWRQHLTPFLFSFSLRISW